eukprot:scaffold62845_cov49-Attheya_sp.AAC.3
MHTSGAGADKLKIDILPAVHCTEVEIHRTTLGGFADTYFYLFGHQIHRDLTAEMEHSRAYAERVSKHHR